MSTVLECSVRLRSTRRCSHSGRGAAWSLPHSVPGQHCGAAGCAVVLPGILGPVPAEGHVMRRRDRLSPPLRRNHLAEDGGRGRGARAVLSAEQRRAGAEQRKGPRDAGKADDRADLTIRLRGQPHSDVRRRRAGVRPQRRCRRGGRGGRAASSGRGCAAGTRPFAVCSRAVSVDLAGVRADRMRRCLGHDRRGDALLADPCDCPAAPRSREDQPEARGHVRRVAPVAQHGCHRGLADRVGCECGEDCELGAGGADVSGGRERRGGDRRRLGIGEARGVPRTSPARPKAAVRTLDTSKTIVTVIASTTATRRLSARPRSNCSLTPPRAARSANTAA